MAAQRRLWGGSAWRGGDSGDLHGEGFPAAAFFAAAVVGRARRPEQAPGGDWPRSPPHSKRDALRSIFTAASIEYAPSRPSVFDIPGDVIIYIPGSSRPPPPPTPPSTPLTPPSIPLPPFRPDLHLLTVSSRSLHPFTLFTASSGFEPVLMYRSRTRGDYQRATAEHPPSVLE
ncbi:hypothetical protein O3P69_009414 [Scylla paramamosain]|uniref:Uncharacterized protein n=1 Tax=Scylla paramamosain TaxID=85552 RepID=A0AAW0SUC0_SCYPA